MSRISHVLDTSALLAHYFDEPGATSVEELFSDGKSRLAICAVTVAELRGRLSEEITDKNEAANAANAAHTYLNDLTICLSVDRATAEAAWQLREATPRRLPLVDALIAATARVAGAVLVHKDPHMSQIPSSLVGRMTFTDGPET